MKGVVSCGHRLTAKAAYSMLEQGGNAFDAVVAACFASFSTEPMLTSAACAGIGLLRFPEGKTTCVDFLADFPSRAKEVKAIKKVVSFGDETQVFYLGGGSVGVPGGLPGMLHIHRKYGSLELGRILAPAIKCADGHKLNRLQHFVCTILEPFSMYTKESREVFAPKGKLLKPGDTIRNAKFASFLRMLAEDEKTAVSFYHDGIEKSLASGGCALTMSDIRAYRVAEHRPVSIDYRGNRIELASPPSAGGALIAHALKLMEDKNVGSMGHNSLEHLRLVTETMKLTDSERTVDFFRNLLYGKGFWQKFLKRPDRLGGTTHISVIDKEGNAAGVTTSNGQGAGVMVDGTGIMYNNFAAEPDLMQYRELYRPQRRITTMMTPTIISRNGKPEAVLGSGGSNRIRSAVFQTISNMLDFGMAPQKATDAARVHYEAGLLQLEHGIRPAVAKRLSKEYKTNVWSAKNLFFGGVHIATPDDAGGDNRRGGAVVIGRS